MIREGIWVGQAHATGCGAPATTECSSSWLSWPVTSLPRRDEYIRKPRGSENLLASEVLPPHTLAVVRVEVSGEAPT